MHGNTLILVLVLLFTAISISWAQQDRGFQQKVDYLIEVSLDDRNHTLDGNIQLRYFNHSPDTLTFLYFHLWGNAFQKRSSCFAQAQLKRGNTDFHFSNKNQKGGYNFLQFLVNGEELEIIPAGTRDVARVLLHQPLPPGEKLDLQIPFQLKIPSTFSRLGRDPPTYQISQWYPKPAVYDENGWHPMPYLDQGEFYSEFGNFRVRIQLPEKYTLAATGQLIHESKSPHRTGGTSQKTYIYEAKNVHDFAWFADPDYRVASERIKLKGGRNINIFIYSHPESEELWKNAGTYARQAIEFYSDQIGPYPYPQLSIAEGSPRAGSGMEYPMITVIGPQENKKDLEQVIVHEIGHNWWYGILANNERKEFWLDEGINSAYEKLYFQKYHQRTSPLLETIYQGVGTTEIHPYWVRSQQMGKGQPIPTPVDSLTDINYYFNAYWAPSQMFLFLREFLGAQKFRHVMRKFYDTFAFQHYSTLDLQQFLESETESDLDWFFQFFREGGAEIPDFEIKDVKKTGGNWVVTLSLIEGTPTPIDLGYYTADSYRILQWIPPFEGEREIKIADRPTIEALGINLHQHLPEKQYSNNIFHPEDSKLSSPSSLPSLGLALGAYSEYQPRIYGLPALGYNYSDGFQMGALFHNQSFPGRGPFAIRALGMFGLKSQRISGGAEMSYTLFQGNKGYQLLEHQLGLNGKTYSYRGEGGASSARFGKVSPFYRFRFQPHLLSYWELETLIRSVSIFQSEAWSEESISPNYTAFHLQSQLERDHPLFPSKFQFDVDWIEEHLRVRAVLNQKWQYGPSSFVGIRWFLGWIPQSTSQMPRNLDLMVSSFERQERDFYFDEVFLGRGEKENLGGQQLFFREGSLKSRVRTVEALQFASTAELRLDFPIRWLPVSLYYDLAFRQRNASNTSPAVTDWLGSGGIAISIFNRSLELFFPLPFLENNRLKNQRPELFPPGYFRRYFSFSIQFSAEDLNFDF